MIGEIDLYGVLLPPLLAWLGIAMLLAAPLRWLLNHFGLYNFVWHRPLFDLSLLVIILGIVAAISNHFL
jgi:hypothetical protein